MCLNQWRQFRQKHLAHGVHLALSLQHAGKTRQIGFEPVLFSIAFRGSRRLEIIVLMLSLSSATSPRVST